MSDVTDNILERPVQLTSDEYKFVNDLRVSLLHINPGNRLMLMSVNVQTATAIAAVLTAGLASVEIDFE